MRGACAMGGSSTSLRFLQSLLLQGDSRARCGDWSSFPATVSSDDKIAHAHIAAEFVECVSRLGCAIFVAKLYVTCAFGGESDAKFPLRSAYCTTFRWNNWSALVRSTAVGNSKKTLGTTSFQPILMARCVPTTAARRHVENKLKGETVND